MKSLLSIVVQGKTKKWSFHFDGEIDDIDMYKKDGLEVWIVHEVRELTEESMAKVN
jgi:hypothetical protein